MMGKVFFVACFLLASLVSTALSYSFGAGTCTADAANLASMASPIASGNGGYSLTLSSSSYTAGASITVSLHHDAICAQSKYRGILLYAEDNAGTKQGAFTAYNTGAFKTLLYDDANNCGANNVIITHTSGSDKCPSDASFTWTAPGTVAGPLTFRAAVVRTQSNYFFTDLICLSQSGSSAGCSFAPTTGPSQSFYNLTAIPGEVHVFTAFADMSYSGTPGGFYWNVSADHASAEAAFYTTSSGWAGLGFGSRMVGSKALIWARHPSYNNTLGLFEYYISEQSLSGIGRVPSTIAVSRSLQTAGKVVVFFSLNFTDAELDLITAAGPTADLAQHCSGCHQSIAVDLLTGRSSLIGTLEQKRKDAHGALMFLAFGCFLPLSILAPLWFRRYIPWFNTHLTFNFLTFAFAIAGFGLAIDLTERTSALHFSVSHAKTGLAVIVLLVVQLALGATRLQRSWKGFPGWLYVHRLLALSLVVFATYQIFSGLNIYGRSDVLTPLFAAWVSVWGVVLLAPLLNRCFGNRNRNDEAAAGGAKSAAFQTVGSSREL